MTLICTFVLIWFMQREITQMLEREKDKVRRGHYMYDLEEVGTLNLSDYQETFTLIIAMTRTDFDILDNPFIQLEPYKVHTDWQISQNNITLRKCTEKDLKHIMDKKYSYYI